MSRLLDTVPSMATQTAIARWDKVLDAVEKSRESWLYPEAMTPEVRKHQYSRDLPMIIETVFSQFVHAWNTDRPDQGSDLYQVLEPIARAIAAPLDFTRAGLAQVDPMMAAVAEARSGLQQIGGPATAAEVVADIEHLLKVTVLVARVSHQGSTKIIDDELQARFDAINKNKARSAKYLDLHTFQAVEQPSKTTISLQVVLSMIDPGIATLEERMNPFPEETYPPIMKQFAAQLGGELLHRVGRAFSPAAGPRPRLRDKRRTIGLPSVISARCDTITCTTAGSAETRPRTRC